MVFQLFHKPLCLECALFKRFHVAFELSVKHLSRPLSRANSAVFSTPNIFFRTFTHKRVMASIPALEGLRDAVHALSAQQLRQLLGNIIEHVDDAGEMAIKFVEQRQVAHKPAASIARSMSFNDVTLVSSKIMHYTFNFAACVCLCAQAPV